MARLIDSGKQRRGTRQRQPAEARETGDGVHGARRRRRDAEERAERAARRRGRAAERHRVALDRERVADGAVVRVALAELAEGAGVAGLRAIGVRRAAAETFDVAELLERAARA